MPKKTLTGSSIRFWFLGIRVKLGNAGVAWATVFSWKSSRDWINSREI